MTTTKTDQILAGYDRVVAQVCDRYAAIREMLASGNVVGAQSAMEELASYHARQSLGLRNAIIRAGHSLTTEKPREQ